MPADMVGHKHYNVCWQLCDVLYLAFDLLFYLECLKDDMQRIFTNLIKSSF